MASLLEELGYMTFSTCYVARHTKESIAALTADTTTAKTSTLSDKKGIEELIARQLQLSSQSAAPPLVPPLPIKRSDSCAAHTQDGFAAYTEGANNREAGHVIRSLAGNCKGHAFLSFHSLEGAKCAVQILNQQNSESSLQKSCVWKLTAELSARNPKPKGKKVHKVDHHREPSNGGFRRKTKVSKSHQKTVG